MRAENLDKMIDARFKEDPKEEPKEESGIMRMILRKEEFPPPKRGWRVRLFLSCGHVIERKMSRHIGAQAVCRECEALVVEAQRKEEERMDEIAKRQTSFEFKGSFELREGGRG